LKSAGLSEHLSEHVFSVLVFTEVSGHFLWPSERSQ
jgi:hypothetical protein